MNDEETMDDVILQVFEQHADKFTFPLLTHKQARDFVRLLNRIGLTYEMMAEEVGEKKTYFENWRLISNEDNAIGEKVIKRLNRPLQDTMLIEDDADDDDGEVDIVKRLLFSGKSIDIDVDAEATLKALDEKRHSKALEALREAAEEHNTEKENSSSSANKQNEEKTKDTTIEKKDDNKKDETKPKLEPKASGDASENKATKAKVVADSNSKDKGETEKALDIKSAAKLEKESQDKKASQDKKLETPTVSASKLTTKVENTISDKTSASGKASETDKTPTKSSEKSAETTQPKEKTSDKISTAEKKSTEKTSLSEGPKEASASVEKKSDGNKESNTTSSKTSQKLVSSPPTSPTSPTVVKVDPPKVEASTKLTTPDPAKTTVAAAKSENIPESDKKISKEPEQLAVKFGHPKSPIDPKPVNGKDTIESSAKKDEKSGASGIKWSASSESSSSPSESSSPVVLSPSTPAPKAASTPTPVTPVSPPSAPNLKPATLIESTANPSDIHNYDSDLDSEEVGKKSDQAKLIDSVCRFKTDLRDGAGYVYILSDTSGSKPVEELAGIHRVRIGASRFPQKRFEQAKTYNLEIKLVTSKHVTNRRAALAKIQDELSSMLYRGTPFWYRGAIEKILEALEGLI